MYQEDKTKDATPRVATQVPNKDDKQEESMSDDIVDVSQETEARVGIQPSGGVFLTLEGDGVSTEQYEPLPKQFAYIVNQTEGDIHFAHLHLQNGKPIKIPRNQAVPVKAIKEDIDVIRTSEELLHYNTRKYVVLAKDIDDIKARCRRILTVEEYSHLPEHEGSSRLWVKPETLNPNREDPFEAQFEAEDKKTYTTSDGKKVYRIFAT